MGASTNCVPWAFEPVAPMRRSGGDRGRGSETEDGFEGWKNRQSSLDSLSIAHIKVEDTDRKHGTYTTLFYHSGHEWSCPSSCPMFRNEVEGPGMFACLCCLKVQCMFFLGMSRDPNPLELQLSRKNIPNPLAATFPHLDNSQH